MSTDAPVIFLMGPTAAGKTAVAMDLAGRMDIDIISVDSAMIYQSMDIGTAKPSAEELAVAPHALIDFLDPSLSWSAGEFCLAAKREIIRSHEAGRVPVLAGGTMMYFRALEEGLAQLPTADRATREQLNQEAAENGWPALHAQLRKVDPAAAARIHENDAQRIQRALEVYRLSGRSLSSLQQEVQNNELPWAPGALHKFAIDPGPREQLHERIATRFEEMMRCGLVDEVRSLYLRGDLNADMPSIRCVGYRQIWAYLESKLTRDEAVAKAIVATRQLAKRQMTWLRSTRNVTPLQGGVTPMAQKIQGLYG